MALPAHKAGNARYNAVRAAASPRSGTGETNRS